jgi:hypothetical protein
MKPNFFKLETPSFDEGYFNNMVKTGKITSVSAIVNVSEISSIERYKGTLLHEGWDCSKVIMNTGKEYIDKRSQDDLLAEIKKLKYV